MNGKGVIVAIVGVGIGLAGLILNSQRTLAAALETNRSDIAEIRSGLADVRERMARLEGLFEGHLNRGHP